MAVEDLLSRLDAVRQVGAGRWRARCPAHDGKNRDVLSVAETPDGVVLVKCFHGCATHDVARAVGLELHDLFPKTQFVGTKQFARPRRPRVDWPAVVAACEQDMLLVKIVLAQIARHETVNDVDARACGVAATRVFTLIQEARNG